MLKYTVRVNGKKYKVELPDTDSVSDINEIIIDGKKHTVDFDADTVNTIMLDNNTHKINGVYEFNGELVKLLIGKDYHDIEVEEEKIIKKKSDNGSKGKELKIMAPMPGKIISVKVKEGDRVEKDTLVLVLEAMKMENTVKAGRAGLIKQIKVKEGSNCNTGDILVVIE